MIFFCRMGTLSKYTGYVKPHTETPYEMNEKIFYNTIVLKFLEEHNVLFYKTVQQFLTISLRVLWYVVSNSVLSPVTLPETSHKAPGWPFFCQI